MGVTNKSLASHLQLKTISFNLDAQKGHGDTGVLAGIQFPCELAAIHITAFSISDTPAIQLHIARFTPGTAAGSGFTLILIGTTFAIPAFSISGCLANGISLPNGSSTIKLQPSDMIGFTVYGGGVAVYSNLTGCVAVRPVQDNIVYFNNLF